MVRQTPTMDARSAEDIFAYLAGRWRLSSASGDPLAEALLRVFSRYCEIIIQRLNQVPDKNYLAFLNLLEVSRIPPVAAWAPLTFFPVRQLPQSAVPIQVPAHTKVAAPVNDGEGEPVVFETVCSLTLTDVRLVKVVAFDPQEDRQADRSALASQEGSSGEALFVGEQPVQHAFYIGHKDIFGTEKLAQLRLNFDIDEHHSYFLSSADQVLEWRIPTAEEDLVLTPSRDTTKQLTHSGEIVFDNLPKWPACNVYDILSHWLMCRLLKPLNTLSQGQSADALPRVKMLVISALWRSQEDAVDQAFFNNLPLDISKDFFPLGERPRFGDVFYLSCEAFCRQQANVTLIIKLTNPVSVGEKSPIRPVNREAGPEIQWETWCGNRWIRLDCLDETQGLSENGTVYFTVPDSAQPTVINGLEGAWVRARLVSGGYGHEERFEFLGQGEGGEGLRHVPSTLAPPAIQSMGITWSVKAEPQPPEAIVTHNNLAFQEIDLNTVNYFLPFQPVDHAFKSFYMGFSAPKKALAGAVIDLYFYLGNPTGRIFARSGQHRPLPRLTWQYWNGRRWRDCPVDDGTACLTNSGIVSLTVPEELSPWRESSLDPGRELCWIRVLWESGEFECRPMPRRILLNTVPATHTITLENELLGSSDGTPRQVFRSARIPILGNLQLEIRVPYLPGDKALDTIQHEEGEDAVTVIKDSRGLMEEIWIRWHEVKDFLSSNAHDRHFVVNRLSGEISFGDGIRGLVPHVGTNNIRLRCYRTGGGTHANKPAGSITQMRTAIPFVNAVTNLEAASGGQDVEDWDAVQERGPRWLRHRQRAVTVEDYEDLAKQASAVVARAKCYPLYDLAEDPSAETLRPGVVSVVIVPHSTDPFPKPTSDLLRHVQHFLDRQRSAMATDLVVLAPEYISVVVETEIAVAAGHDPSDLLVTCRRRLNEYLNPLTGGFDAQGWMFGRLPRRSDFYPVLEALSGVEYVRSLHIVTQEERSGLLESGIFLVSSGQHAIRIGPITGRTDQH